MENQNGKKQQFIVDGDVRLRNGDPIKDVNVRAYDKDFRREQLLGEVSSDAGHYTIEYGADQFTWV